MSSGGQLSQADREHFAQRDCCLTCGFNITECGCPIRSFLDIDESHGKTSMGVKCCGVHIGEFEISDDGYYHFWPDQSRKGYWSQELITALGEALERINKNWDRQVRKDIQ